MDSSVIYEEQTPYSVLLYRKSGLMRLLETGLFLAGFAGLFLLFPYRSVPFIMGTIVVAAVVIFGFPALFRALYRPRYVLYEDKLVIYMGNQREEIPLVQIEPAYDLPYIFRIRGKRRPLLVSNQFVDQLQAQLEIIRRTGARG
ncbi:hypothetical protein JIR001_02560 [Polycladomyces abyssicola]|uniref:Uncharacterized protein n=1 Tax=Polycladomyces abyssicola TaxID=1125966 RepID=A0A8D5UD16_9BACL|nr:hypothetical protein [Polycladomyces abyssicola]BCU80473.1 hypothetical protein JIR001_02560 [Polycladomyces abyssicola]